MQKTPKSDLSNEGSAPAKATTHSLTTDATDAIVTSDTLLDEPQSSADFQTEHHLSQLHNRRIAVDVKIASLLPMDALPHQSLSDQTPMNELTEQIIASLIPMNGVSDLTISRVDQATEGQSPIIKIELLIRGSSVGERVGRPDVRPGRPDDRESGSDERVGRPDVRPGRPDDRESGSDERVGRPDVRPGRPDDR